MTRGRNSVSTDWVPVSGSIPATLVALLLEIARVSERTGGIVTANDQRKLVRGLHLQDDQRHKHRLRRYRQDSDQRANSVADILDQSTQITTHNDPARLCRKNTIFMLGAAQIYP
jgi:uncharacterized protein (DUF2384 family)